MRARAELAWVTVVTCLACTGAAAEHESLGDRAYAGGRYADALVEYRLAAVQQPNRAELRAKAGAAALRALALDAAVEEFAALAELGGEAEVRYAADGLTHTADRALEDGDQAALTAALLALRKVAPERAVGRYALHLMTGQPTVPRTADGVAMLRVAAAGAGNARTQDSLMLRYGLALRQMGDCEKAMVVFESLARRERDYGTAARAATMACGLLAGRRALDEGQPSLAESWFRKAIAAGGDDAGTRAAYIGLGDVLFAQGDYVGAAEAYLRALEGLSPGDSLHTVASERLNAIANAGRIIP